MSASCVDGMEGATETTWSKIYIYNGDGAGETSKMMLQWALKTFSNPDVYRVEFLTPNQIIEGMAKNINM